MANMCDRFKKVTHVIFDMDGLLLDTEKLYTEATQKVLNNYGKLYTWDVKMSIMGMRHMDMCRKTVEIYDLPITPEEYSKIQKRENEHIMINAELMPDTEIIYEDVIRLIAQEYGKPYPFETRIKVLGTTETSTSETIVNELQLPITAEEFLTKFREMSKARIQNVAMKEGAERLMRHLHSHNIPICLATSSSEDMVEIKITNHRDVFDLLHHRVCGSTDPEVKKGKPAPDIFLIAASRFPDKPKPIQCLVFEDAPNGVQAACCAGMQVVMVPDERVPEKIACMPTLRIKSLLDFKPEMFGLPPFDN